MNKLFCFLLILMFTTPCVAASWSLAADWNDSNNISGPWSYRSGGIGAWPNATGYGTLCVKANAHCGQPCWISPPSVGGPEAALSGKYSPGCAEIDPNEVLAHGQWLGRWVCPAIATNGIEINATIWQVEGQPTRQTRVLIIRNGIAIREVDAAWDENTNHTLGGKDYKVTMAPLELPVVQGDIIDFLIDGGGPNGDGVPTSAVSDISIREVEIPIVFELTVLANPGYVDTVTPLGVFDYSAGFVVDLNASTYSDCPNNNEVLVFSNWTGGVANPASAATTVTMDNNKTVTANYVDGRTCGDVCHPYPALDFNQDCIVNLSDFAEFASDWMNSTRPQDD